MSYARSIRVHDVYLRILVPVSFRRKRYQPTVRRPGWRPIVFRMVREACHARSVGIHDVYIPIPILILTIRDKRYPPTIRRPGRGDVKPGVIREACHARSVGVHDVYIKIPTLASVSVKRMLKHYRRPSGDQSGKDGAGDQVGDESNSG